jgi:hypothetical protein
MANGSTPGTWDEARTRISPSQIQDYEFATNTLAPSYCCKMVGRQVRTISDGCDAWSGDASDNARPYRIVTPSHSLREPSLRVSGLVCTAPSFDGRRCSVGRWALFVSGTNYEL